MVLIRVFAMALVMFLIVGCGKKEAKNQQPPVQQPVAEQNKAADALFDEFFDNTPQAQPEPQPMPVETFSAPVETTPDIREVSFSPDGRYVVQVSTIASPTLADEIAKKLERNGFPVYVVAVENPTTELIGTYYRVRIGGFDNISDAKYFGENMLNPLGYDFWVDNKSNDNVGIGGQGLGNYPQAVDYDAQPAPAIEPVPAAQETPVVEEWGTPSLVDTAPAAPASVDTTATAAPAQPAKDTATVDDNNWDNFEW